MKQIITASIVFLLFTLSASAQKRKCGNEGKGAKGHKKEFAKNINMTAAQKEQAKQYNENYQKQVKDLKSNDKITMGDYKAKKAALETERKSNMQNLFTPEQKKQMDANKQAAKLKHTQAKERKMGKMKEHLNLSDSQVTKIKANQEKAKEQKEKIKMDNSLTKEQKHDKLKELKKANKEQFLSSLSPEQKQKLAEKKNHKKEKKQISK